MVGTESQSWQDAGQQGLTPTQGQILALLIDKGAGMRLSEWQNILRLRRYRQRCGYVAGR